MAGVVAQFRVGLAEIKQDPRGFWHAFGLVMLLMASYGFARTPIESLYLDDYGGEHLPVVWMAVGVAAALALVVYSRFASKIPMHRLYWRISLITSLLLGVLLILRGQELPGTGFALYICKDLYVVMLVESFWSLSSQIFRTDGARIAYGWFCAAGAIGAFIAGKSIGPVGELAAGMGLKPWAVAFVAIPLILLSGFICRRAVREEHIVVPTKKEALGLVKGLQVIRQSKYLVPLLLTICTVQVSITLIEYVYQNVMATEFPEAVVRDPIMGQVQSWIEGIAFLFMMITGVLVSKVGVTFVMLSVPLLLGATVGSVALAPMFATVAAMKVASKSLDYSLFRAAKEMLFVPLSFAEKTQGKAFDMFIYRAAKGWTSALLFVVTLGPIGVAVVVLGLIGVWTALIAAVMPRYRRLIREKRP